LSANFADIVVPLFVEHAIQRKMIQERKSSCGEVCLAANKINGQVGGNLLCRKIHLSSLPPTFLFKFYVKPDFNLGGKSI